MCPSPGKRSIGSQAPVIIILSIYVVTIAWTLYRARKLHARIGWPIMIIYVVGGIVLVYLSLANTNMLPW